MMAVTSFMWFPCCSAALPEVEQARQSPAVRTQRR